MYNNVSTCWSVSEASKLRPRDVSMKVVVFLLFVISASMLTGCTNSEWVLSALYNRMDNVMAGETKEYADFTPEQIAEIDLLADQFHQWHRTEHLPLYADLLLDINSQIEPGETVSRDEVARWSAQVEGFAREMAECYPLNNAFDLLRNLSDEQVDQILAHGIKEYDDFIEDRIQDSKKDRVELRYDETKKWFRRFSLNLNEEQRQHLIETIEKERLIQGEIRAESKAESAREATNDPPAEPEKVVAGIELWKLWVEEFVEILEDRNAPDFEAIVGEHIHSLWNLQYDKFPEVIDYNRQLWITYFYELAESQTPEQRQAFSNWLVKMASNIDGIASRRTKSAELPTLETTQICKATIANRVI